MELASSGVFERAQENTRAESQEEPRKAGGRLRAAAAVLLMLTASLPQGLAQSGTPVAPKEKAASDLPQAPQPEATASLYLRPSLRNFSQQSVLWYGNPLRRYLP